MSELLDKIAAASRNGEVNQAAFVRASLEGNGETWADVYAVRGDESDWTTPVSELQLGFTPTVAWTQHAVHVIAIDRHDNSVGCFHVPISPDDTDVRICATCGKEFKSTIPLGRLCDSCRGE